MKRNLYKKKDLYIIVDRIDRNEQKMNENDVKVNLMCIVHIILKVVKSMKNLVNINFGIMYPQKAEFYLKKLVK